MSACHRRAQLAALSFITIATPAFADGELVITATRTPAPVERLPARVDVIDRIEIEEKGLVTLADALRQTPGLAVVSTGTYGAQTSVFSRGANSKHTLALFDGIRINDPTAPNGQYDFGQDTLGDLDRVEVLRGAASSVYGSDAIGGVVNLVPRRGADAPFAPYFDLSGGSFGTARGVIGAAGTIAALRYGVTVDALKTDGYDQIPERFTTRTGGKDGANIATVTATAAYALGGRFTVDALVRHRSARADFDTFSGGPSGFQRADDPRLEIDRDAYTIWRVGAEHAGDRLTTRIDGGQVLNTRTERDAGAVTGDVDGKRSFIDLTASIKRDAFGPLRDSALSVGAQWSNEDIDNAATLFTNAVAKSESNTGLFAVGRGRVGKGTDISLSLRVDDNDGFGAETTGTLGVSQDFTPLGAPVRVYASYGTSYKAPTLSERFGTNFFNVGNATLRPEEGKSAELGLDWSPLTALRLGATLFDNRITGLIDYDFASLRNINVDRAMTRGVESYIEAKAGDRATVRVSYVYTDAHDVSTPGAPRLLRRPPHAWAIDAHMAVTDRLDLSAGWTWASARSDVTYDNDGFFLSGSGRNPGYDVGSVSANFAFTDALTVYAAVRNVADTTYEDPNAFRGAPRSVMVGLRGKY